MSDTVPVSPARSIQLPAPTRWERAYQAFETPQQEVRKFVRRLRSIGADRWSRSAIVVEVCSGRGSGLHAWHALGFRRVLGVDYSAALLAGHQGPGQCVLGDARALPLASASVDVAAVQGGLHHLVTDDDVEWALAEMSRVVVPDGRILIIEPWQTPFLRLVHAVSEQPAARRVSSKLDAFETMREEERVTYERWLNAPDRYLRLIQRHVALHLVRQRWGKLTVVGAPKKP